MKEDYKMEDYTGPDITIFLTEMEQTTFDDSRKAKNNGLIEKGDFNLINRAKVPLEVCIFNSRFVDKIKNKGIKEAF